MAANDRPLIFGMNPTPMSWWGKDPNTWDPILFQRMAAAGCASARIGVNWDQIEPTKGTRNWSETDRWVKLCLDNNIEPVILINSTPEWALPSYYDPNVPAYCARYPPGEQYAQDFHNWIYDLVRRYRGRARYYEFWNEANGYGWYQALLNPPSYSHYEEYTPWMIRCYKALKLADPTAMMSTTGLDDCCDGNADYFVEGIYQYGGKGYFDAVADHPYPDGGPFQAWKIDDVRNVLLAHGDSHVKVWITEFGYAMNSSQYPTYQTYMTNYFNTLTQDQYSYVTIATWHTANDFPWEAGYGLMDKNLNYKPPYYTFQSYTKPTRPSIYALAVSGITASSATITYKTTIPSRGLIMYGETDTYGLITAREAGASTSHSTTLIGLKPNRTYHYRIRTGAVDDGDAFYLDRTFTTASGAVVNITSGPTVSDMTDTTAVVTWTTDVPSTGTVEYGLNFAYGGTASHSGLSTTHVVQLTGLQKSTTYQYRVISSASGYGEAVKEGYPFTTFALFGTLGNGGFEDGTSGWTYWEVYPWGRDSDGDGNVDYPGHISVRQTGGAYVPTPGCVEGAKRLSHDAGWASCVGGVYQTVPAHNGLYIVSGWMASGCDGGTELVELRALDGPYSGGIPGGTVVGSVSASTGWTYYAKPVNVTTGQLTVCTRVSQYYAVEKIAGHFDALRVRQAVQSGIREWKNQAIGTGVVTDAAKAVTMVVGPNDFYVEEADRSCGIRVHTLSPHGLQPNDIVTVVGALQDDNGELIVGDAAATKVSTGTAPSALTLPVRSMGGGDCGVQGGIAGGAGVNNVGLLVKVCGRVKTVGSGYFYLDDGSAVNDGTGSGLGVRVISSSAVSPNDFVAVTGASACVNASGNLIRLLRAKQVDTIPL